ncbi:MAG TPA: PAS domain S-box protein [Casimicrobiaceae bacterium]|nr:PAS domain S-box protein [Casimicrobiaceae bacterium]
MTYVRRPVRAYAIAFAALAAAVLLRWVLDPAMGDLFPLVTLFAAVAIAVWAAGWIAATLVTIVGYLVCAYLFVPPRGSLVIADLQTLVGLAAYLLTCALIIVIGERMLRAQSHAAESGEMLRVTLGSIGDGVITTDTEARITYLNAVAATLTGWTPEEARGQPLDAVFHIIDEQTRKPIESPALRALRAGTAVGFENHATLVHRRGDEHPIDDSAAPIVDELRNVSGCVLIFRDVSERRRFEIRDAARLLDARLLASIVESSDDAIISKSLDGVIRTWNAAAQRLFGHTAEAAVGRHISLVIPPDRLSEEDQIIASLKAGRRVEHFETERVRSDGRRIWVSLTISPIRDDAGNVIGASKIVRDVTRQREAENERQKFVTLVENSTDFIGICDLAGVPSFVNRAGLSMVGLADLDEAKRTPVAEFFFPEDRSRIVDDFLPRVAREGHGEIEVRFRHFRSGAAIWMAYKVVRLDDATGKPFGFATVSQNVTERRRLEDNLRKLATDLSEVDRRKDEFLATLSHELRNPLAPMRNMLEILKRAGNERGALPAAVDTMERQLGQLVRLVDDLLDLSRITHNRIGLRRTAVDLGAVIRQAVQSAQPLADGAGHVVDVTLPERPILLHADAVRLTQIFGNLINNACKYTRPGGRIRVIAERDGAEAVVSVTDNGIGIPRDKLDTIFDMFSQIDRSLERSQGGLGIGLTLVKRLVQMHGGTVHARSEGEGRGSTFVVRLPIPAQLPDAVESPPDMPSKTAAPRRILVVDDNRDAASSLAVLLQLAGNETFTAFDGAAALDAVERHRPDMALLDIGMPRVNGYEACRRIRAMPGGKDIVLVALTGWGQEEDRRKSRDAGFDAHLVKPVAYDALVALLDSLAEGRHPK